MTNEIITLIAWILISIGYTLPFAFIGGEWKTWFKVWLMMIGVMVLMASGLWLLGVR